jgi:2-keto-4-pentenoate hydratase
VLRANVLHRAFVLGARRSEPAREAHVRVGRELRGEGVVDFDLYERVEVVRDWLDRLGERLDPGDWIITGSIVQVPVEPGDEVEVELPGLGRLATTITA